MFNDETRVDLDIIYKKCKKRKTNIKKKIKFNILNLLIIFSIQRFDLKPYSDEQITEERLQYRLIGTIYHNGTL